MADERDQDSRLPHASTDCKISCWVDQEGCVDTSPGRDTDGSGRIRYEFDLELRTSRRISASQPLFAQEWSVGVFFDRCAGTAEKLMRLARRGVFGKTSLARLLRPDKRPAFFQSCSEIEKAITVACAARGEPCLEGGCAVEGEICLEACFAAGAAYHEAYAAAWIDLFEQPENRIDPWRISSRSEFQSR